MKSPIAAVLASACLALPLTAAAQTYPAKPIRLMIPVSPGPGVDQVGRVVGSKMAEDLGQPLVVDNRPGANGVIGTDHVVRSAPDGYNILLATPSMVITVVYLMKQIPYDPIKDLAPISAAVEPVTTLVVNPSVPAKNVRELIDWVKQNPGKVSYGSAGVGSVFHMVGEMFKSAAGVDITHVPYKSVPPAVAAVMAGEVQIAYSAASNVLPHHRAGKLRILGVLERERFPGQADIPAVGESVPGFEKPASWFGFFAPAGTPRPIIQRLNGSIVKALNSPDVRKPLEAQAFTIIGNSPEQFAAMVKSGLDVYARAVKIAGLKPE
jgi:tripartite-type tricarboxylate transporter receptor subunit TctC